MIDYHEMSSAEEINYRKSGFLFAGIIALIYALLLIRGRHQPYLLIASAVIAVLALLEAWPLLKFIALLIRTGNVMHRFTNPLVFGLIYVVAIIPTAFVLKMLGKDVMCLRFDSNLPTYWKTRNGVSWQESFRNQF